MNTNLFYTIAMLQRHQEHLAREKGKQDELDSIRLQVERENALYLSMMSADNPKPLD